VTDRSDLPVSSGARGMNPTSFLYAFLFLIALIALAFEIGVI
jgi:hypothetical protein